MLSEARAGLRVAHQIERRQFRRGQLHIARLRLAILDPRRHRRHVLAVGKDDPRPSGLDVGQEFVRDDLKLHDGLMGSAVGRRRRQQPHIIGPLLMAHQGVDIPFGRRRSRRGVLWRHDHVEAAPGPDKLAAPLQALGGVEERARLMPISFCASSAEKTPGP